MVEKTLAFPQQELMLDTFADLGWRVNFKKSHLQLQLQPHCHPGIGYGLITALYFCFLMLCCDSVCGTCCVVAFPHVLTVCVSVPELN